MARPREEVAHVLSRGPEAQAEDHGDDAQLKCPRDELLEIHGSSLRDRQLGLLRPPGRCPRGCCAAQNKGQQRGSLVLALAPSTPPLTRPETMLPIIPRSKVGDDLPAPAPPGSDEAERLVCEG